MVDQPTDWLTLQSSYTACVTLTVKFSFCKTQYRFVAEGNEPLFLLFIWMCNFLVLLILTSFSRIMVTAKFILWRQHSQALVRFPYLWGVVRQQRLQIRTRHNIQLNRLMNKCVTQFNPGTSTIYIDTGINKKSSCFSNWNMKRQDN